MTCRHPLHFAGFLLLTTASPAESHHAFAPTYDDSRKITIEGTVEAFHLVNPHASMILEVVDDAGRAVKWIVELDGRPKLTVAGWDEETVPVGAHVSVTGNPSRTGSPKLFFNRMTFDDGRELVRPYQERLDRINAQRREQQRNTLRP